MLKTLISSILAIHALPLHAETWNFAYQGFQDRAANIFLPDRIITGSFAGHDANANGAIERAEITSLVLNDFDYVACESQSNEFWRCGTEHFSYQDGKLLFRAGFNAADPEGWVGGAHYFIAGDQELGFDFRPGYFVNWSYHWTPQTTFTISAVPEPGTWALLLAGLPLAAFAARRRKQHRLHDAAEPM
jgi:hypothetical protein